MERTGNKRNRDDCINNDVAIKRRKYHVSLNDMNDNILKQLFSYCDKNSLSCLERCCKRFKHLIHEIPFNLFVFNNKSLLDLSDCALLYLLKYCDASSLYYLSKTCKRLESLVETECLWINVDARTKPNTKEKVIFCQEHFNDRTFKFSIASDDRREILLTNKFFINVNSYGNLKILALENQTIDGEAFPLQMFPQTLEEISLTKSYVMECRAFFRHAHRFLINLRVFLLNRCQWLEADALMPLGNLPNLEILSLYMCKKITDDNISYISLSTRFGFKKLKILDLRFTGLGNQMISSIYRSSALQELYFQHYCLTYLIDRYKTKEDILNGYSKPRNNVYEDTDHIDLNRNRFERKYGPKDCYSITMDKISTESLQLFDMNEATTEPIEPPKDSVLFQSPYTKCNCYEKVTTTNGVLNSEAFTRRRMKDEPGPSTRPDSPAFFLENDDSSSNDDDDDNDNHLKIIKRKLFNERLRVNHIIGNRHFSFLTYKQGRKVLKPNESDLIVATPENRNHKWLYQREPMNAYEISMLEHSRLLPLTDGVFVINLGHDGQIFPNDYVDRPVIDQLFRPENIPVPNINEVFPKHGVESRYIRISVDDDLANATTVLKKLSLRGYTSITNRDLGYLINLNLDLLDVTYTNVTEDGVKFFKMRNPNCRVLHESACTCTPRLHF